MYPCVSRFYFVFFSCSPAISGGGFFCKPVVNTSGSKPHVQQWRFFAVMLRVNTPKFDTMQTVLITGGTGLIGQALTPRLLEAGYRVIVLTRDRKKKGLPVPGTSGNASYANWDSARQTIDEEALADSDYIIHLAGAGVADKRWTAARKKVIVDSRVQSGKLLARALGEKPHKVRAVISASAIGWYGPDPRVPNTNAFTEDHPASDDFLGNTCREWEAALQPVSALGIRLVTLRTGVVLSNEGGAFPAFRKPASFGVAPILGSGRQVISWIHMRDLAGMYLYAMDQEQLTGVYNAVAPHPVSNRQFIMTLARDMKGKFFIPVYVPAFVLRVLYGEMSIEVLKSTTVSCDKIRAAGFHFVYPTAESAIRSLVAHHQGKQA